MMPIYFILVHIALWCSFRPFLFHASLFSFPLSTTIPQTSTRFLFLTVRSPDRELYLGRKCISVPWCTYLWNFSAFFLNLSPMVPLPWVSLSSTGSNLIDREVTSQVTCVFWKIWHFCLFVPHICFSFFYSLQIWLNKWTKYALLCHIIGWKYCFYTSVVCFSSPYLKHLNKNYPVITSGSPMTPPKPLYLGKSPDRCCMCGQGNTSVHITNSALHYMVHWTSSKYFSWSFSCSPFLLSWNLSHFWWLSIYSLLSFLAVTSFLNSTHIVFITVILHNKTSNFENFFLLWTILLSKHTPLPHV